MNNSIVTIKGNITDAPEKLFKDKRGTQYYKFVVRSYRLSSVADFVPVICSEELLGNAGFGATVRLKGELQTRNYFDKEANKTKLDVSVTVTEPIEFCDGGENENDVTFEGRLVKKKDLRGTPLGKVILDSIICIYGDDHRNAYIPCITWGRLAYKMNNMSVGTFVKVRGRFQSRTFYKHDDDKAYTAYEVSISDAEETEDKAKTLMNSSSSESEEKSED